MVVISCFLARGRGREIRALLSSARLGRLIAFEGRRIIDRIKKEKKKEEMAGNAGRDDENLSALEEEIFFFFLFFSFFPFSSSSKSRGSCV